MVEIRHKKHTMSTNRPLRDVSLAAVAMTLVEQTERKIAELQAEINRQIQRSKNK